MRSVAVGCVLVCSACGRVGFDASNDATAVDATPVNDPYGIAVLADHPVAYWRFEERTGATVRDHVAGYTAALVGGCSLDRPGALTDSSLRAIALDGTTCRIVASDILDFVDTPFTIELWANIELSDGSVRWLVSHMDRNRGNAGYAFSHQDTTLWVEHNGDNATGTYIPTTVPSLATYHHLAYTFRDGLQRIYIDGVIAAENAFAWNQPDVAAPLVFGDFVEENPNKFKGSLDELAFYARELSQAELVAHIAAR